MNRVDVTSPFIHHNNGDEAVSMPLPTSSVIPQIVL